MFKPEVLETQALEIRPLERGRVETGLLVTVVVGGRDGLLEQQLQTTQPLKRQSLKAAAAWNKAVRSAVTQDTATQNTAAQNTALRTAAQKNAGLDRAGGTSTNNERSGK
jgi:hypothetical protein